MIYSKSTYDRIRLYCLIASGLVLVALFVTGIEEYRQSEAEMRREIPPLFEQAIDEEVKLKMKGEYFVVNMGNDQSAKEGKVRKHTIITEEGTITKDAETGGDVGKDFLKTSQSYLLQVNRLQPDTLQQIFESKLEERGIRARAVILVRHGRNTEACGDTTRFRARCRLPVVKGGVFEEISYEGLLCYSPFTVFGLMPKSMLVVLFTLEFLMLGLVTYLFVEKQKVKPDKIMKKGRYYFIGETVFDTRKNELSTHGKTVRLPNQPADILLMFLESEGHLLGKEELQERFWKGSGSAYKSLTSTANRLRNYLKEADCAFTIATKKSDNHYRLEYTQEGAAANRAGTVTLPFPSSPSAAAGKRRCR